MRPDFDLVQYSASGPFEAAAAIAMSILGLLCISKPVEDILFSCQGESCQRTIIKITEAGNVLTFALPG